MGRAAGKRSFCITFYHFIRWNQSFGRFIRNSAFDIYRPWPFFAPGVMLLVPVRQIFRMREVKEHMVDQFLAGVVVRPKHRSGNIIRISIHDELAISLSYIKRETVHVEEASHVER